MSSDDASHVDHLAEAKQAVASSVYSSSGYPEARAVALAQVHALIAIAEAQRGAAIDECRVAAEDLNDGDQLLDGSVVVRVEEPFDEPELVFVSVARGKVVYRLGLLRSTPVAVAQP